MNLVKPERISLVLFLMRLSVFLVMLMWVLDKFLDTEHASAVFQSFYGISGLGTIVIYIIGAIQLLIIIGFVAGFQKLWTYGAVLGMHGVSTLVSFERYFNPFESSNLLFFAAWPMLAACFALFYLRDLDKMATIANDRPSR